jgi:hypothetical protein
MYLGLIKPRTQISEIARKAGDFAYLGFLIMPTYATSNAVQKQKLMWVRHSLQYKQKKLNQDNLMFNNQ